MYARRRDADQVHETLGGLPLDHTADAELFQGGLVHLGDLYLEENLVRLVDDDVVDHLGGCLGLGSFDPILFGDGGGDLEPGE